MRQAALPADHRLPVVHEPRIRLEKVEGKGAVHSYSEVHHAIQPAFRGNTPYLILLVDLDTQKGEPTPDEALRVVGNLATPDGQLAPPEMVRRVGDRHPRAHGVQRCRSPASPCRNGRSTRPRRSRQSLALPAGVAELCPC